MGFIITTDTTCDLPEGFAAQDELALLYMQYTLDGVTYDGKTSKLPPEEFYAAMRRGSMPQTAQINPAQATECFEGYLKSGISVLHISFSSALSGSCGNCKMAAAELNEKYRDSKVIVVDSLAASMGEGLLVYYALEMKRAGKSMEEIAQWLEDNKLHLCHFFTVNDLFHLHRGGRVSKAAAIVGTALGIKPVLHVDNEGRLVPIGKVRGRKQALTALVDNMGNTLGEMENEVVFISHGDCLEDAEYVKQLVSERFGIKRFLLYYIGPVVGTHSGPGTVALFFLGENR